MNRRCRVAVLDDLRPGSLTRVDPDGVPVCLIRLLTGEIYALSDICSHEHVELSDGDLDGDEVECPAHGSRFSAATGEVSGLPAEDPVPMYKTVVIDEEVFIDI